MKPSYRILLALLSCLPLCAYADLNGKVVRVLDGDTVEILVGQQTTRVRLNGIDAPEKDQPYGQRSRQYLTGLIGGKQVVAIGGNKDRYGRLLATIILHNQDVNAIQVYAGMAWAYRYQGRLTVERYADYEHNAKSANRGLWSQKDPIEPRKWRKYKRY
ncbi:thermonuclease family protein [Shigella sonnei]|uniref:Nuclease n=1 Tax=Escherichia coli TaxID=562 RepID=A0A1V2GI38_ECOLX|nr:thermonuclease family protein [Escherichia coli]EAB8175330.1 nuclease [Salmonella enterica subsp. enterica serovar Enteritidis]EDW6768363.1 nuclease [Salmonella enterica subsp. enterica serovar Johannesburg]EFV9882634.1 nuclease [Shigella sonnei]EKJ2620757.1 thermonuclease family protein [Shigella flexneri]HBN2914549.1 thermonuclease family protein [Escherichia coli O25b:H4-ST131]